MHSVLQDLRYGWRALVNSRGFTIIAVLTLALGIGANTAIFSYVDATWLRPLPVRDADRLVKVFTEAHSSAGTQARGESSYVDYLDVRTQAATLEDVIAYEHRGALLHRPGEVTQLEADTVSPNYFTALGVSAALGRTFSEAYMQGERFPIVISHSLWQQQFGADPSIVGKDIQLSNGIVTIVGVMPREFRGVDLEAAPSVWIPASVWTHITGDTRTFANRGSRRQQIVARVRVGVKLDAVRSELNTIASRLAQSYPDIDHDVRFSAEPEADTRGEENRRQGWMLLGISTMVLLIACANVANLQLARAEARRLEFATRLALGGSRGRLLRQMLTESLLLATLGATVAVVVANWTIRTLPRLFESGLSGSGYDFRIDSRALAFTIAAAALAVLLSGVAPGLRASRVNIISAMKGADATLGRERRMPIRDLLVAGQVALSVLLLVCAGLLTRTFFNVRAIEPGFNARQSMLLVRVVPGLAGYEGVGQLQTYYRNLLEQMNSLPGVEKATLAVRVPFEPSGGGAQQDVLLPGMAPPSGQRGFPVNFTTVASDYFNVIGTRLRKGRAFTDADTDKSQLVAVVNESMARQFWPNGDVIGKPVRLVGSSTTTELQVVGVVEDAKWNVLTERPRSILYLSMAQRPQGEATLLLRTQGDPAVMVNTVRQELLRVDGNVPMLSSTSLKQHIEFTMNTERTRALLSGAFGMLGLSLAAAGIYGVLSYYTSRRTREIGLRIALGATKGDILEWVLHRGLRLVVIGLSVGLPAAIALSRLLQQLLFGVRPADPLVLMSVAAALLVVAVLAIYVPAYRASSVDPMEALRDC